MTSQLWSIWCPANFYLLPISFLIYSRELTFSHSEAMMDTVISIVPMTNLMTWEVRNSPLPTLLLVSLRFTDSPIHLVNSGKDRRSNMHSSNASAASPVFPKGRLSVLVCLERRKRMIPPGNIIIIASLNIYVRERALTHPKKLSGGWFSSLVIPKSSLSHVTTVALERASCH